MAQGLWLRWLFMLLMLATGIGKLLDMPGFVGVVATYRLLPEPLLAPSAWALVLTELVLAAWLLWGKRLQLAALLLIGMHLMFMVWQLVTLLRGISLDNCGCFGVFWARPLTWFTPLEDLLLIALAVWFWRATNTASARGRAA